MLQRVRGLITGFRSQKNLTGLPARNISCKKKQGVFKIKSFLENTANKKEFYYG
jgi:hypothetical protein